MPAMIAALGTVELVVGGTYGSMVLNAAFLLASCAAVSGTRRRPELAYVGAALLVSAWTALMYPPQVQPPFSAFLVLVAGTFFGGLWGRLRWSGLVLAGLVLGTVAQFAGGAPMANTVPVVVWLGVAWGLGLALQRRRREAVVLEARAEHLEAVGEVLARDAVAAERARIARELHDVISHGVSVMVIQASVEHRLLGPDGGTAAQTLSDIERTGRETLEELRRLLGLLRGGGDEPSLAPQPGLGELGTLVDQARSAGLRVDVRREGEAEVSPGVGLAVYRIAQEALTNVLKHAEAHHVRLDVETSAEVVTLRVVDDGRGGPAARAGGHGLVGMRERVAVYGGTLEAGQAPDGGFEVVAVLPRGPHD